MASGIQALTRDWKGEYASLLAQVECWGECSCEVVREWEKRRTPYRLTFVPSGKGSSTSTSGAGCLNTTTISRGAWLQFTCLAAFIETRRYRVSLIWICATSSPTRLPRQTN